MTGQPGGSTTLANQRSDSDSPAGKAFSRAVRLRNRREIEYVKRTGATYVGTYCLVKVASPMDENRRVGIIVSRRHSLKAVERNRSRRLLKEAYRQLYTRMRVAWIILIPRSALRQAKLDDVLPEMTELCCRAGLLSREAGNEWIDKQ